MWSIDKLCVTFYYNKMYVSLALKHIVLYLVLITHSIKMYCFFLNHFRYENSYVIDCQTVCGWRFIIVRCTRVWHWNSLSCYCIFLWFNVKRDVIRLTASEQSVLFFIRLVRAIHTLNQSSGPSQLLKKPKRQFL